MPEAVFRRLDRDRVVDRLREFAGREFPGRPEVREVVLIGSLARGDWSASSDADLVVIVDDDPDPARARAPRYRPSGIGVAVDVLVYTADEVRTWSKRFAADVAAGLTLYRRLDPPADAV